jgi:hypothetical protein
MIRFGWLAFFAWVPVLALLVGLGVLASQMQVISAYEYSGGNGYAGLQGRHYARCTYVGLNGTTTIPAQAGRCGWFRLTFAGGR